MPTQMPRTGRPPAAASDDLWSPDIVEPAMHASKAPTPVRANDRTRSPRPVSEVTVTAAPTCSRAPGPSAGCPTRSRESSPTVGSQTALRRRDTADPRVRFARLAQRARHGLVLRSGDVVLVAAASTRTCSARDAALSASDSNTCRLMTVEYGAPALSPSCSPGRIAVNRCSGSGVHEVRAAETSSARHASASRPWGSRRRRSGGCRLYHRRLRERLARDDGEVSSTVWCASIRSPRARPTRSEPPCWPAGRACGRERHAGCDVGVPVPSRFNSTVIDDSPGGALDTRGARHCCSSDLTRSVGPASR